jgi:hypothetical protein
VGCLLNSRRDLARAVHRMRTRSISASGRRSNPRPHPPARLQTMPLSQVNAKVEIQGAKLTGTAADKGASCWDNFESPTATQSSASKSRLNHSTLICLTKCDG